MWLEIIITLLLGGLFYILVGQRDSKPTKSFKVTDRKRDRTVLLKYTSFESFSEKCRDKFDLRKNEKLHFASGEDENLELDEECLDDLKDKSLLIVKGETTRYNYNDDVDENVDSLGFESHGSDSFTGDTAFDIGDMKRWKDIQAGRDKFDLIGKNEKLHFASGEDGNLELNEECLVALEDKSLLIVKEETSGPNDDDVVDEENGDCFENHGRPDSFTGDNIVDDDDMKKSEDIQAGRAKFDLGKNEKLHFESAGDEECLVDLEDKSLLIVKGETSGPNDVDDENDDWLGCIESGSFTGDTVVDNADMRKWEHTQSGSEVKEHISKYGLINIAGVLRENVDAWKSKPLSIAVTGESGKGKSSFINAFRGISPGQEGAAKVDEEECTTDCRAFRHPKYDSFVLWDVPGVGTKSFPKEKYLNSIQFDTYDFFIIISSDRLSELDSWLAKEVLRRKKRFYFIRTKVDTNMSQKKMRFRKLGQHFHENEEFDKLKSTIYKKLCDDVGIENLQFFMISNHHPNKYDFPLILKQLLQDVPTRKKDAMLFGLAGMSQDILVEKASALKSRIWKVALLSGVGATIPIPFLSTDIDTKLILEEVLFYRNQFGLDDQSLKHLADMAGISLQHLKCFVNFKTPGHLFTSAGLAQYLLKCTAREVAESVSSYWGSGFLWHVIFYYDAYS